ncbi:MAG TPA: hypothetical protein VGS80_07155 [Ktedonobacterales bacterium]|nr:hypothetical protein [Ktedonobacterales bacterium]
MGDQRVQLALRFAADYLKAERAMPRLVQAGFGLALGVALYFDRHRAALA